jgi:hypothetical protein
LAFALCVPALLALGGAGVSPAAAGSHCQASETTAYRIDVEARVPGSIAVDQRFSRDQLGAATAHGARGHVLGLMRSQLDVHSSTSFGYAEAGSGYCFWLQEVNIVLEFPLVEIYVAREYKPGSCAYRAILDHEQDHLRVAQKILDPYAAEMRSTLTSLGIPKPNSPWFVDDLEAAKAKVGDLLGRLLNPIYNRMQTDMTTRQAQLDTPYSYKLVRQRCRNW